MLVILTYDFTFRIAKVSYKIIFCKFFKKQKNRLKQSVFRDAYRIQTYDLLIRSQMLYSAELRRH